MRREILKVSNKELSIELAGNQINSVRNRNLIKKGAWVFKDGKIFSSNYVGSIEDSELLDKALRNEEAAIEFDYNLLDIKPQSVSDPFQFQSEDDLFVCFQEAIDWLKDNSPNFIFSGRAYINKVKKEFSIDENPRLSQEYDLCKWILRYKHKKSASTIDGYLGAYSVYDFDMEGVVKKYVPYLNAFENEVELKGKKNTCCLCRTQTTFYQSARKRKSRFL